MELPNEITAKGTDELTAVAQWVLNQATNKNTNVVALYGQMGSGKTTLITQIALLKQVTQTPSSPTFAIINDYTTPQGEVLHHFDFYRVGKIEEAYDLGYQEYLYSPNLCLIEWPELIEELLPPHTLRIQINAPNENLRTYTIVQ